MKRIRILSLFLLVLMISCKSLLTVKPQSKKNEITISQEMRDLKTTMQTTKSLSVVLRTPFASDKVTAELVAKNAELYNRIERNLLRAGFTVRDRGLLESLLKSGQTSYEDIGKKIQTDLIIEILNIDFLEDNYVYNAFKKKNKKPVLLPYPVNAANAKFDCKITIVNKGLTGGVFTLYKTACTEGCDFEYSVGFFKIKGMPKVNSSWYKKLKFLPNVDKLNDVSDCVVNGFLKYELIEISKQNNEDSMNEIIDYFSTVLIDILRGNF